jgi:methyl-accepting chemotaxis protein
VPGVVRRSYVLKFGITLLILGLMVGAIGFVGTGEVEEQMRTDVDASLQSMARQEAESVRSWNERNRQAVDLLATTEAVRSDDVDAVDATLTERTAVVSGTVAAHYIDTANGTVLASTEDETTGSSTDDLGADWTEADLGALGSEVTSVATYVTDDDTPVVAYGRAVDEDRALVYLADVGRYRPSTGYTNGTVMFVVTQGTESDVVFDSTGESFGAAYPVGEDRYLTFTQRNDDGTRLADIIAVPPRGSVRRSVASFDNQFVDERYLGIRADVPNTDWTVVVHTPRSLAYGAAQAVRLNGYFATLASVIVIGLIGAVLGRNTATAIDRLRRKAEQMEGGNLGVDFGTERIDNIGRLHDSMAGMRDALRKQIVEARGAREEAERAREKAERTSKHLQSKATEYSEVMQAVANGNLDRRMDPSDRNEAMREIAAEFNHTTDELERTVARLKSFAGDVATSSEEVTASAEEVRGASQQVTNSIQEISDGADRQNDALQSVNREMSGLSTTVEEIASLSNEVADLAERTAETGRRGREAAQEAIAGMNQIEMESEEAVDQIEKLDAEMQQIDELIEFITEVADQTNMLALNANIEASRADDGGGEGFAVVANEVKDLAEETKQTAEDVEGRLERLQAQAERTVVGVQNTGDKIEDNTESVRNAVEALDEIASYAQETNNGVQEISAATQEQAASTQQVVSTVDEATAISERTSNEAENVAAAAEEQTTAMTEVSASANDLSEQASRLSEALGRFTTGDDDAVSGPETDGQGIPDAEKFAAEFETPPTEAPSKGTDGDKSNGDTNAAPLGDDEDG